jgi:acyl-coenzyme A thioesterase PaaI-like protein
LSASRVTVEEVNAFLAADFPGGSTDGCADLGHGWSSAVLRPGADRVRPGGIISGHTVFGLCDAVLYYACFTVIGLAPMTLTSGMSIRYLGPAFCEALWARADIVSVGRRNIVGNIVAWTESVDQPVATCQGTCVRPR